MPQQEQGKFNWEMPEFVYKEKKADWFWALGVIAVGGVVLSIIFGNYLLALLIFLAGALMAFYATQKPHLLNVSVNDQGIRVNNSFYSFKKLDSFWFFDDIHGNARLLIHSKRSVMPIITIPVHETINLEEFREFLLNFIPEKETDEPLSHKISDAIGF